MSIKTKNSRDTFRSNVKSRPLNQNGLEAQYQGLDIREVNIDHAGLAIIGRGGHQTRRNILPVRKQYIVDVDIEEHFPTAEILFELDGGAVDISRSQWSAGQSLQGLIGQSFEITDASGNTYSFQYSVTVPTGNVISGTIYSVSILDNLYSMLDLLTETKNAILQVFPTDTFQIEIYPSGSQQVVSSNETPVTVKEDKIKIILLNSAVSGASIVTTSLYFDTTLNVFEDQQESHEWRLNGVIENNKSPTVFYEDIVSDTIQFVTPHSWKSNYIGRQPQSSDGSILPAGTTLVDVDSEITNNFDPTSFNRYETKDSDQVIIKQVPQREEVVGAFRENHQWREDPHYMSQDQQTWTNMLAYSSAYHSSFEDHVNSMLDENFADEQYIEKNPLSGRVDVFHRLSRIFEVEIRYISDRRPYSVFEQYLESSIDYSNINSSKYPKRDVYTIDDPFEDNQGKRNETATMFEDYFDSEPLETHDYYESERWTAIDNEMLDVLTFDANRSMHIDRREWQQSDYVHTATGLISSQVTGQDGIMYRELMR